MGKRLISENNLNEFICDSTNKIYVDSNTILTPGAKDALTAKGLKIEYGPKPEENTLISSPSDETLEICKDESCPQDMLIAAAYVLKNDYGITDPSELKKASYEIVDILKKNL